MADLPPISRPAQAFPAAPAGALPPPLRAGAPFVLLDDASPGASTARLYLEPAEILIARHPHEVAPALARAEAALAAGWALAGYVAYEAGLALEPRLEGLAAARCGADGPLVWLGLFAGWHAMPAADVPAWLATSQTATRPSRLGPMQPQISPGGYARAFAAIDRAITDGDIYQANFTFPLAGRWQGDPLAIYAALRGAGGAAHGGIVAEDGGRWLLSLSPELFLTVADGALTARPMKGTRPRGATPAEDAALAADLAASVKDRAENLMILDLMRNDISRVAAPGSVRVAAPFAIESYPTVHQMVSTVTASAAPGIGPVDVVRALFPCGSVTGAPKIRAMELIQAHERDPRGAYCGAIGHFDPPVAGGAGAAAFNVAIRTLVLSPEEGGVGTARLGVGSAVVADSQAMAEWRECLVKGGFVHQPGGRQAGSAGFAGAGIARFDLIETMAFSPEAGVPLLEAHLQRLTASAAALGFAFDRHAVRNAIQALCFEAEAPGRLRLCLARSGAAALEIAALPAPIVPHARCVLLPNPYDPSDWRLAHKTSDRGLYEAGLAVARRAGAHEALLLREDGQITEGCYTNLFVPRGDVLVTPPLALGLLPGVLRASLLAEGRAVEGELRAEDLAGDFFIGNALRGLIPARLLA